MRERGQKGALGPRFRTAAVVAAMLLAMVAVASGAQADPVTVTSGQLYFDTGDPPYFALNGIGLSAGGVASTVYWAGTTAFQGCGINCPAGTTISLASVVGGGSGPLGFGSATVNGTTYTNPLGPDVWYGGVFSFSAGTVAFGGGATSFSTPFSFTGHLQGYSNPDLSGPALFNLDLRGAGDATLQAFYDPGRDTYGFQAVRYTFKDAATTVTPEPASILLLGSGVVGALGLRRRGRQRR